MRSRRKPKGRALLEQVKRATYRHGEQAYAEALRKELEGPVLLNGMQVLNITAPTRARLAVYMAAPWFNERMARMLQKRLERMHMMRIEWGDT